MPKMKTRSAVKKRFTVTGSGKIKRGQQNKNHILNKKSRKRKRNLRKMVYTSKADTKNVKTMLCL